MVRMLGARGRNVMDRMRRSVVRCRCSCIDRQPTVHDAGVQLRRLRQTNDEPDGEHSGQNPKEQ